MECEIIQLATFKVSVYKERSTSENINIYSYKLFVTAIATQTVTVLSDKMVSL